MQGFSPAAIVHNLVQTVTYLLAAAGPPKIPQEYSAGGSKS